MTFFKLNTSFLVRTPGKYQFYPSLNCIWTVDLHITTKVYTKSGCFIANMMDKVSIFFCTQR